MKIYLGNKMSGVPYFNAPWFDEAAFSLRKLGFSVFNPAEWDRDRGFEPMLCPGGTVEEAQAAGFDLRDALLDDWRWIANFSEGLVIGPDWRTSKGTISEIACHQALGLPVWEFDVFTRWHRGSSLTLKCFKLEDLVLRPLLELGKLGVNDAGSDDDGIVCDCF